jgi:hypothetical protein
VAALAFGCASAQKTEFQTVSAAAAGVEAARSAYQDFFRGCQANPASLGNCSSIVAAHDSLSAAYTVYQKAVQALADANVAALATTAAPDAGAKVAAATAGLLQAANDFVALETAFKGGK